ncbi:NAD(P)H-quinone oxidoreductase [Emcibacter sp. SYSU 3D8]|uniref:NAD(P)H-quinone oxidoreductase n=1 Tax=Emcibacter sp. SYSU 3D8 TaxID=3133969 RepID=UPI0031FF265D
MSDLPKTAPAIVTVKFGGPENMEVRDIPVDLPKAGEILIRVRAAGLNRADAAQREGHYPPPKGSSEIMGLECAGEVAAIGDGVTGFKLGDRVCALLAGGGYATYCAVPAIQALPLPKGFSFEQGAAIMETYCTVWTNVFERGRLQKGERLLVHGGSSGIGTSAVALAAALGAEVYATAGTAEKCQACVDLGAKRAINYKTEDYVEVIKAETGDGVDVVLDMVGGDYLARDLSIMRLEGRHVSIAALGGNTAEIPIFTMMLKRLTITGSTLRARTPEQKGAVVRGIHETVWPLFESGRIAPVIDSVMPLADAAAAHRRIESSAHIGKIILKVD